ncbi:hypothetical protein BH11MYX3_BH11MYX3_12380 [soil metagenome]
MDPGSIGRALAVVAVWATVAHAEPATTRIIYLAHDGIELRPGATDSRELTSSVVKYEVSIPPWRTRPEVWAETVACVQRVFAPFAVEVTDQDPGDEPHLTAVFGGSPSLLDLPRSNAGISPFRRDCSVIEHSIVFAFTDILPDDARTVCNVIAQEIGHSYGLDHALLVSDPMSTQHAAIDRAFADQDLACGETEARPCGLPGATCRATQNSYALLGDRLGFAGEMSSAARDLGSDEVGCSATGRGSWGAVLLAVGILWQLRVRMSRRIA